MLADLRFAVRGLLRSPGFALIAVLTLALGIGANSAIFSVVDAVLLRPLPYPASERIMHVGSTPFPGHFGNASFPDFADWRAQNRAFAELAAYHEDSFVLTGGPEPVRLDGVAATANLFAVLGVEPAQGRGFRPGEDQPGKASVAVLTYQGWQKRFGGDPEILRRTITVDDRPLAVIGVLPRDFRFVASTTPVDLFVPVPRPIDDAIGRVRNAHYLQVLGRLAPGATEAQAQAEMDIIQARLAQTYPDDDKARIAVVKALKDVLIHDVRATLWVLLGAVGFVLLIACANVANLLLARATARQRELAIRIAIGAGRGRLVRQMLTESVLLSLLGGFAGVMLALWGLDALRGLLPGDVLALRPIGIDARVLAFTVLMSLATGVVFGLFPALHASGESPAATLKEDSRTSAHGARARARNVLVASEIAVAMLLLVGAGLMLKSFHRLTGVDPGIDPEHVYMASLSLPDSRYHDDAQQVAFYKAALAELSATPGAETVALGTPMPFSGNDMDLFFNIDGRPKPQPGHEYDAQIRSVSPSWFAALRIPLKRGRLLADADDNPDAERVVVVNERFAAMFFPGEDAIGHIIDIPWQNRGGPRRIVGVVGNVRGHSLELAPDPEMYLPFSQMPMSFLYVGVRTAAPAGLAAALRARLEKVDAAQPLSEVTSMTRAMSDALAQRRLGTLLLAIFGSVALVLAVVGVYGVMSYTVTQRTQEMGIRMALGARAGDVARMVVRQGLVLALAGAAVGLVASLGLSRLIAGLLFGVAATDPVTYAAIATLLVGVAAVASWLPARRAARVDPMIALRRG